MAKDGKRTKRIPKKIGGLKIPKDVRRAGDALIDQAMTKAQSPHGRQAIAAGLTMAAGAIAAAAQKQTRTASSRTHEHDGPVPPVPPIPPVPPLPPLGAKPEGPSRPGEPGVTDPHAVGEMVGNIVGSVMERLFGDKAPPPRRDPPA